MPDDPNPAAPPAGGAPGERGALRRWLPRLAVAVALVAVWFALRATLLAPEPVPVEAVAVAAGRVESTVTNTRAGTVTARRRARLSPEIAGRVAAIPHRRGALVRAGEVVLQLDDAAQRAALELARRDRDAAAAQRQQACLEAGRAGRERERLARLAQDGIASTDLLDQVTSAAEGGAAGCRAATAAAARAAASVGLAEVELAKTTLRAPFDAVVGEVEVELGEWTTPSPPAVPVPPVLDLIDPTSIYVAAPMDEVDAGRIRVGQPARVTVDSRPGGRFAARVARIAPYVLDREEQNRTVEIEVELDDPRLAAGLLPGTSADVEVILAERDGVLRVPTAAVQENERVLVVGPGDRLVERRIVPGLRNWDATEVRSGLAAGERVVTSLDRPEVVAGARVAVAPPRGADRR